MHESATKLRVLILDDEPLVLAGVAMLLRAMGHTVTESINGESVLRLLHQGERFDLAILDLSIHNGLGALDIVSQLTAIDASMKTVVSSGFGADDAILNYSHYGFSGTLPKPFSMNDLSSLITRLFSE